MRDTCYSASTRHTGSLSLREVQLYNSIKNLSTLAGHCEADGAVMKWLVDSPRVTVRGTQFDLHWIPASVIVPLSVKVINPVR